MTLTRLSLLSLSLVACGGGGGSGGSVSGTVHGQSYSIADSVSSAVTITTGTGTQHAAAILMASSGNLCPDLTANTAHPSEKAVIMTVFDVNGMTFNTPVAAGTYSIYQGSGTPPAKSATMSFVADDATCKDITADAAKATTGTVTLTQVSGNIFAGNYDVALDSGDHVTGSFSPEECPAIQTTLNQGSGSQSTCM